MSSLFRNRKPEASGQPGIVIHRDVSEVMTTPVLAVHGEDDLQSVARLMDEKHILHLPVISRGGRLEGLVTYRCVLRVVASSGHVGGVVREIMRRDPVAVRPTTKCLRALEIMREGHLGCLPVVDEGKLVGIVTEHDFIAASARLLEDWLREG